MNFFKINLTVCLLLLSKAAFASGLDDLQRFYKEINSYSASFEQTVLDEKWKLLEASSGEFLIQRPGKFRWHYTVPSEQLIVGDGKQIWIYDVELEQITHRKSSDAISQTPAMLLSGKGDLNENFILEEARNRDGMEWVRMIPKNLDSGFTNIHIGFLKGKLKIIEMQDSFGQSTQMRFSDIQENGNIPEKSFIFNPPENVDVIEETG